MIHRVYLLTADAHLEARLRAATARLTTQCQLSAGPAPPPPGRCELLLVDDRLWDRLPPASGQGQPRMVLLASGARPLREAFRPGVVDVMAGAAGKVQLQLMLRQQLGILQLLRLRGRLEPDSGTAGPVDIGNPLTGILGNAELALASRGRMPADVRQRLECVRDLAGQIREVLAGQRRAA
ncbi:MAG: hypothetical protein ACRD2E_03900 [Terriglobales bacterium]